MADETQSKDTSDEADDDQRADDEPGDGNSGRDDERGADEAEGVAEPPRKLSGVELVNRGKQHLQEMTGQTPETVSGLERHGDGWRLPVEVLELSRIPPSTDVLSTYQLDLTEDGELAGYRRSGRYHRSQAE